jgi:Na+/melibiose symporter-like transporter
MERRLLSSPSNPRTRLFLPKLIAGSVGVLVTYFLVLRFQPFIGFDRSPVATAIVMGLLWVILVFVTYRRSWRPLKRVAVDDRFLYVSDYGSSNEIAVAFTEIVRVTQWRGKTFRPVTVHLRSPSKFADRIKFQPMATGEFGSAWSENRIVGELRVLAKLA